MYQQPYRRQGRGCLGIFVTLLINMMIFRFIRRLLYGRYPARYRRW
jgi:hypothetical protein